MIRSIPTEKSPVFQQPASYNRSTSFSYDDTGQLTVAWVTNSAGSLVSGESRGYAYDFAQNLAKRNNNGAGSTVTATVNALNQLTSGLGFSGSLVYDRRGNLTSIGGAGSGKAFAYDHENQCRTAGGYDGYHKSDFVYDGKGRLRKRTDYTWAWNGTYYVWTYTGETRYVYDGMLLLQERTSANHPAVTYTRGVDLRGSLAGAGGIGGLLARTAHAGTTPYQPASHAYYHADGNGNVTYLLRQDRTHGASYRYDPYGRLIASSGPLASANVVRFSSKPWHDHSETYYYGYRFYLPEGQRWINRDPIGEEGGVNLYAFVGNSPVDFIDPEGNFAQIVFGVVGGAAANAAYDALGQLIKNGGNFRCLDWSSIGWSATVGAAGGLLFGLAGATGYGIGIQAATAGQIASAAAMGGVMGTGVGIGLQAIVGMLGVSP